MNNPVVLLKRYNSNFKFQTDIIPTFKPTFFFLALSEPTKLFNRIFHENFPEIRINMKEFTDDYIFDQLKKNKVELAIVPGPFNPHYFD
jgi:hypothetical protein